MLRNNANHCENSHFLDPTHGSLGPGGAKLSPLGEREEQRQGCPNVPCLCSRNAVFDYSEGHSMSVGSKLFREESTFLLCIVLPVTERSLSRTSKRAVSFPIT